MRALLRRRMQQAYAPPPPDIVTWARENATIVHPIKGTIPFEPYEYQEQFFLDRSPRRLVLKARQVGMSNAVAIETVYESLIHPGATTLFISKNQDSATNLLRYCYDTLYSLRDLPSLRKRNETEIEFANRSRIMSLPANPAAGRSFAARRVYLDEYAFMLYAKSIYQAVSPALAHGGELTVLSSPLGRGNHYFDLWMGVEGGEWSRHTIHWRDCPAFDERWYQTERPKYTAQQWASEFECDFVVSGVAVFKPDDIERCADGWFGLQPPRDGGLYITAWDIGRRQDATVGITLDVSGGTWQVVAFERLLGEPYPVIQQAIERRAQTYGGLTIVESNGVGDPVIENLVVSVEPFVTTRRTKTDAITALALATERGVLKHAVDDLAREQQLYQWRDEHLVQDCVMAASIACYVAGLPMTPDGVYVDDDEPVLISPF